MRLVQWTTVSVLYVLKNSNNIKYGKSKYGLLIWMALPGDGVKLGSYSVIHWSSEAAKYTIIKSRRPSDRNFRFVQNNVIYAPSIFLLFLMNKTRPWRIPTTHA